MTTTSTRQWQYACKNHAGDIYETIPDAEQRALTAEVLWNLIDGYGLDVMRVLRSDDLGVDQGELTLMHGDDLAELDPSEYVTS